MVDPSQILHAELNLPEIDSDLWHREIQQIAGENWFYDEFRNCDLLPLYTENGASERSLTNNTGRLNLLTWVPFAPTSLQKYFENYVFNWMQPRGRVFAIRTSAHQKQFPHVDCHRDVLSMCQLKMRIVVKGRPSDLNFLSSSGPIPLPDYSRPFLMDGSWPHVMKNSMDEVRYVVAIGSPWQGEGITDSMLTRYELKTMERPPMEDTYFYA